MFLFTCKLSFWIWCAKLDIYPNMSLAAFALAPPPPQLILWCDRHCSTGACYFVCSDCYLSCHWLLQTVPFSDWLEIHLLPCQLVRHRSSGVDFSYVVCSWLHSTLGLLQAQSYRQRTNNPWYVYCLVHSNPQIYTPAANSLTLGNIMLLHCASGIVIWCLLSCAV